MKALAELYLYSIPFSFDPKPTPWNLFPGVIDKHGILLNQWTLNGEK